MTTDKDSLGYNVHVVGRNVLVTPAMKQYAIDKLAKIERFHSPIFDVHVTMDIVHLQHFVTIVVKFEHFKVKAEAHSTDMYASIDLAIDRLQKQYYRWKDRIQDHAKKRGPSVEMEINLLEKPSELEEFNEEIDLQNTEAANQAYAVPKVTGRKTVPLRELALQEAVMKMELSGDHFHIYRSEEDRKLKVIYRRKDGSYGIIQPE